MISGNEGENYARFQKRIAAFPETERWLIDYAYQNSKSGHGRQRRAGGERYFEHPRRAALIVLDEFKLMDPDLVIASLIHDAGEDTALFGNPTKMSYSEWRRQAQFLVARVFTPRTAEIFIAVTRPHVDDVEVLTKEQAEQLELKNLALASSDAKVVKMADRLNNLRDMEGIKDPARRDRKFRETIVHYFPVFETARVAYPEVTEYALEQMRFAMAGWGFGQT